MFGVGLGSINTVAWYISSMLMCFFVLWIIIDVFNAEFAGVGLRDTSMASMLLMFKVNMSSSLVISVTMLLAQIVAALIGGLYVVKTNVIKNNKYERD